MLVACVTAEAEAPLPSLGETTFTLVLDTTTTSTTTTVEQMPATTTTVAYVPPVTTAAPVTTVKKRITPAPTTMPETTVVPVETPPIVVEETIPPVVADGPTGIFGLPFAPEGLDNCDEFNFYRMQWGLPTRFKALAWRESNCRNEDGVRTWCCYGYLQLYTSLHLQDHRLVDRYHECGVYSHEDVNSNTPQDKQRQVCAAAVLFDVVGYSAWGR